jgi:hypothetical protein
MHSGCCLHSLEHGVESHFQRCLDRESPVSLFLSNAYRDLHRAFFWLTCAVSGPHRFEISMLCL